MKLSIMDLSEGGFTVGAGGVAHHADLGVGVSAFDLRAA